MRADWGRELEKPPPEIEVAEARKWWEEGVMGWTLLSDPLQQAAKTLRRHQDRPSYEMLMPEGIRPERKPPVEEPDNVFFAHALGERRDEFWKDVEAGMTPLEAGNKWGSPAVQLLMGILVDPINLVPTSILKAATAPAWLPYKAALKVPGAIGKGIGKIPIVQRLVQQSTRSQLRKAGQGAFDILNEVLAPRPEIPALNKLHDVLTGEPRMIQYVSQEGQEGLRDIMRLVGDMPEFSVAGRQVRRANGFLTDEVATTVSDILLQKFGGRVQPQDVGNWTQVRDFLLRAFYRGKANELGLGPQKPFFSLVGNVMGFLVEQWLGTSGYVGRNILDNTAMLIHLGNWSFSDTLPIMKTVEKHGKGMASYGLGDLAGSAKSGWMEETLGRRGRRMVTGKLPWPFGGIQGTNDWIEFFTGKRPIDWWAKHPRFSRFIDDFNLSNYRGKILNFANTSESAARSAGYGNRFMQVVNDEMRPHEVERFRRMLTEIGVPQEGVEQVVSHVRNPNLVRSTEDVLGLKALVAGDAFRPSVTDYTPLLPLESQTIEDLYRGLRELEDAGTLSHETVDDVVSKLKARVLLNFGEADAAMGRKINELADQMSTWLMASRSEHMAHGKPLS
jgi:hypothetical protein